MDDDSVAEYSRLLNQQSDESLLSILEHFSLNVLFYCNTQQSPRWQTLKQLIYVHKSTLILLSDTESVDSFAKFYHEYCFPDAAAAENIDNIIIKNGGI